MQWRWNFLETYYKQEFLFLFLFLFYFICIVDEVVVIHKDDQSKSGYQQKFTVFWKKCFYIVC